MHNIEIGDLVTATDYDPLDDEGTWVRFLITKIENNGDPVGFVIGSNDHFWLKPCYQTPFRITGLRRLPYERLEIVSAADKDKE